MKIFRNIVVLLILFLPSTHAVGQPYEGLSSVLVEEGKLAEISCVTNAGSQSEYFWRKGESLHNSTDIAFFISGLPTDKSGRFEVTRNGTLIVKKVTIDDEGKYICRVSSEESDCHGEVFVFVQAVLQDFQLTIENCEPENSCVISTESNKQTSLTCKATNASPSMKLKWFNGSHEIKDNIQENSLTKGPSREISSTIRDVYEAPSTLTCQAVDFKTINDDGMFAHVQFRAPAPASTADISPGWIVTAILFIIGFVILFLIIISITVWPKIRKGEDVKTQNTAERESLLSKDYELKEKGEQILKLETDLRTKNDEIKTKSVEISKLNVALMETNADKRVNESNVTSKDTELKDKRERILKLEADLRTKGDEMKTMSEEINNLKDALMETNADKRVNQSNVTSKDKELQDKRKQILKLEKSLETVTEHLSKKNKEHQTQKDNLTQKELQIQKLQSELEHVKEPLTKLQKREQEISSKEKMMIRREADTKKYEDSLNSKISKLTEQGTDIKKQLLDLEKERRKFRLDQMASKDPIRINCKLIALRTGDDARVSKKEKGGQAKVTAKKRWELTSKDAKFHTIYQARTEPKDVWLSIVDLVENAIDGNNSCLIAHDASRREHWTTMLGRGEGASDALVPYAITKIFKRSKELRALDYKVDVTAKFKTTGTESSISESVKNEQKALELLKMGKGNIDQVDGSTDHLVQFFITTETEQETLTGTLVLGTIGSIQMIKECFLSEEPTSQLTQNISSIISDGRCRSVLLTHIHEDKLTETRDCLAMVNEISKKNKK